MSAQPTRSATANRSPGIGDALQHYATQTLWSLQPPVTPVGKILEGMIHFLDQPQFDYEALAAKRNELLAQLHSACQSLDEQILQAVADSRLAPHMPIHLCKLVRGGPEKKLYIGWRRPGEKTKAVDAPAIMRSQPYAQRVRWEKLNARREQIAVTHSVLVYLRAALTHHLEKPPTHLHLEV
jgi:hypothetical protein